MENPVKRKSNNESVKKSRTKKKNETKEKTELYMNLEAKTAELDDVLKQKQEELKKIQTMLFNSKIEGSNRDFTFIEDDCAIIERYEIDKLQ